MGHPFLDGRFGRKTGRIAMVLFMIAGIAAMGALVMVLWNWLMPTLFKDVGQVGYWQALGLLLLSKLLFSGGRGHSHARREHWESMSPDEREHFRAQFRSRWGHRFGIDRWGCQPTRSTAPEPGLDAAAGNARPQDAPRDAG